MIERIQPDWSPSALRPVPARLARKLRGLNPQFCMLSAPVAGLARGTKLHGKRSVPGAPLMARVRRLLLQTNMK